MDSYTRMLNLGGTVRVDDHDSIVGLELEDDDIQMLPGEAMQVAVAMLVAAARRSEQKIAAVAVVAVAFEFPDEMLRVFGLFGCGHRAHTRIGSDCRVQEISKKD